MLLDNLVEEYLLTLNREETVRSYRGILRHHIDFLGREREASTVTRREILEWRASMKSQKKRFAGHPRRPEEKGGLSDFTIYRNMKTARSFWNWVVEWDDTVKRSPMQGIKLKRPDRKSVSEKAAPVSTLRALLRVTHPDPRDWAMYLFLLDTGCRRGGVCTLTIDNLNLEKRTAVLIEKGGHTHKVAFSRLTAKALQDWLDVRPKVKSRAVFLSVRTKDHFSPDGLTVWMRRMCIKAKVPIIGPHAIRHAVGVNLSLQSQPISLLRELFGHKNTIVTAESYMPDNLDEVREMIDRFGLVGLLCDDDEENDGQVEEGGGADEEVDDGLGQAA